MANTFMFEVLVGQTSNSKNCEGLFSLFATTLRDFEWYINHQISFVLGFMWHAAALAEWYMRPTCDYHFISQDVLQCVRAKNKVCVSGYMHQRVHSCLGGKAKKAYFSLDPIILLFVSFVTQLDIGLINGPSTRIWHNCGSLSERSAHVGEREKVWCK